jgi:hypothetical protein
MWSHGVQLCALMVRLDSARLNPPSTVRLMKYTAIYLYLCNPRAISSPSTPAVARNLAGRVRGFGHQESKRRRHAPALVEK